MTFDALLAAIPFVLLLLIGLTHLVLLLADTSSIDPVTLFHGFLPPHESRPGQDPFGRVENVLAGISANRGALSLYAVPAFLWFSTRLFGGIRTSLNDVFDVAIRPAQGRGFIASWVLDKLRDAGMVLATLVLFLANTLLTTGLTVLQARGTAAVPQLAFFVTTVGRLLGNLLAFLFSVLLFFVIYKYASARRLPWRTVLLASSFTALAFELAKRLYALYLANFASFRGAGGDADVGAVLLFVLWLYYTAIVFLLGGVVAETWELRKMQQRQRAILG